MKIHLSEEAPLFDGANMMIKFIAIVDSVSVECGISAEALQSYFDASSPREDDLIQSFNKGKKTIFKACKDALIETKGEPVILRSGVFRLGECNVVNRSGKI